MAGTEQDEIEQIMSEIEELQKEISPEPASEAASQESEASEPTIAGQEEDLLREIQASGNGDAAADASLEETLSDLKEEPSDSGIFDEVVGSPAPAHEPIREPFDENDAHETFAVKEEETMSHSEHGADGTLSLTLTGNMTLKLKYEFEGQEVTISFVDQALRVQMTDGTEFKVPVSRGTASNVRTLKKAI